MWPRTVSSRALRRAGLASGRGQRSHGVHLLALGAAVWYAREATRQTEIQVRPHLLLETSGPSAYVLRVVNVGNGTAHSLEFEAIEIPPPHPTPISESRRESQSPVMTPAAFSSSAMHASP